MAHAGDLDKRVAIQNRTETRNLAGERVKGSWTTAATVYASIRPAGAREQLRAQSMEIRQEVTHTIRIRKSTATANLTGESRILYNSRAFEILGIVDVWERGVDLEILAVEIKN